MAKIPGCDTNVFVSGHPIARVDGSTDQIKSFVKAIRKESKTPVGWQRVCGFGSIIFVGGKNAHAKVAAAITKFSTKFEVTDLEVYTTAEIEAVSGPLTA